MKTVGSAHTFLSVRKSNVISTFSQEDLMGIHNPQLTLTQVSALRRESTDVAGCKASTAP